MAGERILVVDDRAENVEFTVDYVLKPNGYIPLVAYDGAEGLRKALTEEPDLILLDMQMPKMTGLEVLEALNAKGRNIPVILMTFHGSEELAVRVFRLGVKDYVIKPFEVSEMLDAIERALSEVRLRRERDTLLERLMGVNKQLERRVKELNILASIGKSVAALLDLEKLLGRLVDAAVYITGAEEGWLMLIEPESGDLYVRAAKGLEDRHARLLNLHVKDSLAETVLRSGEPIIISGGQHQVRTSYMVKALVATPLKVGQNVIGVLSVDYRVSDRSFSPHASGLLSALADYAAIAIENARLFNEIGEEKTKLEAILAGTSDPIIVTDGENHLVLVNDAAVTTFGLDIKTAVGRPIAELINHKELHDLFARAKRGSRDLHAEIPLDDGRTFNANLTLVPGIGHVVVMQNITHLKELERLKNEFVSTVSHDLRTPLTSIRGFVDLIEMAGPLNEQQKAFVEKIRNGVNDITELINDLLDLGRIEAGTAFEFAPVALDQVIRETVEALIGQAVSKNQRVDVYVPPNLPPVFGNRLRLGQVVSNLVGNAIKYTPPGGHIRVWAEEQEGQILVHVQDNGIGISAQDQTKLFQKFYRVKRKETEDIPGTGLGLAITKSIIERHDGRIWVNSELGKGSTFTFLLPAYKPQEKARAK